MKIAQKGLFLLFFALAYYAMMRQEIVFFLSFILAAAIINTAMDTIASLHAKLERTQQKEEALLGLWPTASKGSDIKKRKPFIQ